MKSAQNSDKSPCMSDKADHQRIPVPLTMVLFGWVYLPNVLSPEWTRVSLHDFQNTQQGFQRFLCFALHVPFQTMVQQTLNRSATELGSGIGHGLFARVLSCEVFRPFLGASALKVSAGRFDPDLALSVHLSINNSQGDVSVFDGLGFLECTRQLCERDGKKLCPTPKETPF